MDDTPIHIYEFGPFRVDALRRLLLREGNQVRLPAKAFEILLVLLERRGRLVEKDELMRRVWPDAVVEENNLTVTFRRSEVSYRVRGTPICGNCAWSRVPVCGGSAAARRRTAAGEGTWGPDQSRSRRNQ